MTAVTDTSRNGVEHPDSCSATLDADQGAAASSRSSSSAPSNRWIDGAHNRSTIKGFYGAGGEDASRAEAFELDAGEPAVLLGTDTGPNPAEYLLHALAACLTTSIVYVAAARKVQLTAVESTLDRRHGRARRARPRRRAAQRLRAHPRVASASTGDAPDEKLREVVERAQAALGRLRHGHQRRARRRRGRHRLTLRTAGPSRPPHPTGDPHVRTHRQDRGRRAPGARSPRRSPRSSRRRAARARPRGVVPARGRRRAQARRLLQRADPGRARRPRGHVRPRRRRRLEPPGPRRRVGRDRRQHAPRPRCSTSCGAGSAAAAAGDAPAGRRLRPPR